MKILFPDTLHFHERNFKSLMDLIALPEYNPIFISDYNELKAKYGYYQDVKTYVLKYYDDLKKLNKIDLFNYKIGAKKVFSLVKAEMLSYLMAQKNWYSEQISSEDEFIFNKAYRENYETLLLNMSFCLFWIDFWKKILKQHTNINVAIVFSNSLIYTKTLSYLIENTPIKLFVVEHFFTGNDYYFEEKYTHIANNSDVKFINFYKKLKNEFDNTDENSRHNDIIKAINKVRLANNKNVKQPLAYDKEKIKFDNSNPFVLIIGQVINDFSILETDLANINSLQLYIKLIDEIIQSTEYNIIFKAHPWEKQKANIKQSLTKDTIYEYIYRNYEEEDIRRIKILEDYNLEYLITHSKYVIGLCSQSLLEAAIKGKKPIQFGDAFFGRKGFTYDFENINDVLECIKSNKRHMLNVSEYNELQKFLTILLQYHLVSVHKSGISSLRNKLSFENQLIKLVSNKKEMDLFPSEKKEDISIKKKFFKYIIKITVSNKKYKKFINNPERFFLDSKNPLSTLMWKIYRS